MATKKKTDETENGEAVAAETGAAETEAVEATAAEPEAVEATADTPAEAPKEAPAKRAKEPEAAKTETTAGDGEATTEKRGKRAEKIGVVASDKMTKTVVVRVDRLVKHPIYRKYVRKRKKFMAHDEMGAKIGDKVKIVETRPMSARKRWRVVEIIQKAEL
ncbi:MAG TPA: 30S ribosomal protein S17 [Pyrinomonadaceae bacterium]|nr:30S ribosomal protein S17 [Pyrinomonadaceae bacterium]